MSGMTPPQAAPAAAPCACGLVDAHTHWVPSDFPAYLGSRKGAGWPSMAPAESDCDRHVMIDGRVYRTVPDSCWSPGRRLEEMAGMGVTQQVVSPMPELLSYWLDADDALALTRFMNDDLAAMCQSNPERFIGLGAVPLQDVPASITELERCLKLGLAGVEIGSNINGKPIGHPELEPFFAAAASMGASIFVHALRPAGMERVIGPPFFEQVIGFPGEIGLAAASVITSGLVARHPSLRLAFSHGAGSLAVILPRLQHAWEQIPPVRKVMAESPRDLARRLYIDDLVYDATTLQHLLHVYGVTQVMAGTDYPFPILDRQPAHRITALGLDADTERLLRQDNAWRWLGRAS